MRGEVILEFVPCGECVRVSAICSESLVEVVVQAPASLPREALERLALDKLEAVKRKRAGRSGRTSERRKEGGCERGIWA